MKMQRFKIVKLTAGVLMLALLSTTGCFVLDPSTWDDNAYSASEDFEFDLDVTTQTELTVQGINGAIEVYGDPDATTISVTGVKRVRSHSEADAQDHLDRLDVDINTGTNGIEISTDQPRNTNGRTYEVNYTVIMPDWMEIKAETTNGAVTVEDMEDLVIAETTNGAIILRDVTGDADLETTNGGITLSDCVGSVDARTTNGAIDGDVVLPENGDCRFSTTNGSVGLDIPATTAASFSARLSNGNISVSGLNLANLETSKHSVTGTLNGGGGVIDLRTTNGNIDVRGY